MISPETLRRFPLFAGIDSMLLKDVAMIADEIEVAAGEWIFEEGEIADALYVIASGAVDLKIRTQPDQNAYECIDMSTLPTPNVLGWSALVSPYKYTLCALASSDVKLIKIDSDSLLGLMSDNAELGHLLMTGLAGALGKRLTDLRVQFISLVLDRK
jgi:CRP-like cAMP-binding protein